MLLYGGNEGVRKEGIIRLAPGIQDCKHNLLEYTIPLAFLQNLLVDPGNLGWGILECTAAHSAQHAMRDLVLRKNSENLSHFVLQDLNILRTSYFLLASTMEKH